MENNNETKKNLQRKKMINRITKKIIFSKEKSSADLLQRVLSGLITKMFSY